MDQVLLSTEKPSFFDAINNWHCDMSIDGKHPHQNQHLYQQKHLSDAAVIFRDNYKTDEILKYTTLKSSTSEICDSSSLSVDDAAVDLVSWQRLHPQHWSSNDVLNLIYFVAEQCNGIELDQLKGERFQDISGARLCSMTEQEFVKRDPRHGRLLHGCIQKLLESSQFLPPEELVHVKEEIWSTYPEYDSFSLCLPESVQTMSTDDDFCTSECNCSDLVESAVHEMVTINGNKYDIDSSAKFDNIHLVDFSSLLTDDTIGVCDSTERILLQYEKNENQPRYSNDNSRYNDMSYGYPNYSSYTCYPMDLTSNLYDQDRPTDLSRTPAVRGEKTGRGRGRPDGVRKGKVEKVMGYESNMFQPDSTTIREQTLGSNKGKHLWELICQLLKKSDGMGKDRIIQWESRDEGVFRIINSKEVAKLWGKHNTGTNVTFEKLSRALRWCRSSGFMSALPKDGKFRKKLCFRFGPRATNWRTLGLEK